MKKNTKKDILERVKNNDEGAAKYLNTYLLSNALIKFIFVLVLMIFGILLKSSVSKLSFITPKVYLVVSIVFLVLLALFIGLIIYNKYIKDNSISPRQIYKIFDAYDLLSFIALSIQLIFFVILFIVTPTTVSGPSMENSFFEDDKLLVWHLKYDYKIDDVVIIDVTTEKYHYTPEDKYFIKRVVAISGDVITYDVDSKSVYVNGSYVQDHVSYDEYQRMTFDVRDSITCENGVIPEGYVIVMGDNRAVSVDSRRIGMVRTSDLLGKVVFRFFSKNGGNFGVPKKNIIN